MMAIVQNAINTYWHPITRCEDGDKWHTMWFSMSWMSCLCNPLRRNGAHTHLCCVLILSTRSPFNNARRSILTQNDKTITWAPFTAPYIWSQWGIIDPLVINVGKDCRSLRNAIGLSQGRLHCTRLIPFTALIANTWYIIFVVYFTTVASSTGWNTWNLPWTHINRSMIQRFQCALTSINPRSTYWVIGIINT